MDPKWLGFRIREARERRGISQDELAAAVSKDQRAISEYENGRRKLAATDLPLFAAVLEVPLIFFFEPDAGVHDLDAALLNYFHLLPTPEAKYAAIEMLRILWQAIPTPET